MNCIFLERSFFVVKLPDPFGINWFWLSFRIMFHVKCLSSRLCSLRERRFSGFYDQRRIYCPISWSAFLYTSVLLLHLSKERTYANMIECYSNKNKIQRWDILYMNRKWIIGEDEKIIRRDLQTVWYKKGLVQSWKVPNLNHPIKRKNYIWKNYK